MHYFHTSCQSKTLTYKWTNKYIRIHTVLYVYVFKCVFINFFIYVCVDAAFGSLYIWHWDEMLLMFGIRYSVVSWLVDSLLILYKHSILCVRWDREINYLLPVVSSSSYGFFNCLFTASNISQYSMLDNVCFDVSDNLLVFANCSLSICFSLE